MARGVLLDGGAQLEKVIMRRCIELGHDITKQPFDIPADRLSDADFIIGSGGPRSVNDDDALLMDPEVYRLGIPQFHICYSMQAVAHQLGGRVEKGVRGQYGRNYISIKKKEGPFTGLSDNERVLMSHFDTVVKVPPGFEVYAVSENMIAAMGNKDKRIYAVQFHPELIPVTKNGDKMFENFFRHVCRFPDAQRRTIEQEIAEAEKLIQEATSPDFHVLQYLSGGVDSDLQSALLKRAIEPERLHFRTLDTGTMRIGEIDEVRQIADHLGLPDFDVLDVKHRFYDAMREVEAGKGADNRKVLAGPLCYTIDPEIKRKIFGTEYAVIALQEMSRIAYNLGIPIDRMKLGQGSLRPDLIESADSRATSGGADTIKTHHNAVDALKDIPKVEGLVEMFKDIVRESAMHLGLGERIAYRQPFPGPGGYCRMIGCADTQVDQYYVDLDKRINDMAGSYGFHAHILPVRTVGVQGDERSYKPPVIVSGDISWKEFAKFALDFPNELREVNRVLYTPGKPLTQDDVMSLTKTLMTQDTIEQWSQGDHIMRQVADQYGFNDSRKCSQMPGIIIPCNFSEPGQRSFVIRPCYTHDFMAIIGMMPYKDVPSENSEEFFPGDMFMQMAEEIPCKVDGISRVILDPTDKPPGSTEWE
ncbi:hypothetical protein GF345_00770 [Candidatus Woesearchaeota archaeon]|nr:hypothetical protein [Candidatus Woesearchaeota archaeon]